MNTVRTRLNREIDYAWEVITKVVEEYRQKVFWEVEEEWDIMKKILGEEGIQSQI